MCISDKFQLHEINGIYSFEMCVIDNYCFPITFGDTRQYVKAFDTNSNNI